MRLQCCRRRCLLQPRCRRRLLHAGAGVLPALPRTHARMSCTGVCAHQLPPRSLGLLRKGGTYVNFMPGPVVGMIGKG